MPNASKAFFCFDAEGTLWESGQPVPGCGEFLALAERQSWPYVVLTNTVSLSPQQLSRAWARQGLKVPAWRFVTPFDALNRFLEQKYPATKEGDFRWVGSRRQAQRLSRRSSVHKAQQHQEQNPTWVVLGDLESFSWNLKFLNMLVNDLRRGARLATLSPSLFYRRGAQWRLDTGSFVRLFEPFLDVPPVILGKPNPLVIEAARYRLGATGPMCVVGDDITTDVQLAHTVGGASLLLRRGKYKPGDENRLAPTWCATTLEQAGSILEQWWASLPESYPSLA
ncbi:MAG: HAD hydrolase-like protein [Spirochaetales bacterium]|nr:HAD hydrolase-like protein [Spirochaetales bacterium]